MGDICKSTAENLRELSRLLDSRRFIVIFHGSLKDQCSTIMHNAANIIDELRKKGAR